jgi:cellulase
MKYSTTAFAVSAAILSGISKVAAHGGVLSYSNAGNWYWGCAVRGTHTEK